MKVLIVDDERLARLRIRETLTKHADAFGGLDLLEASDVFAALDAVPTFDPDLVLLDIEMPELNGFDFLAHMPDRRFAVIFQTAYDEFAVQAFEESACDYLLKPYTDARLLQAVTRAQARLGTGQAQEAALGQHLSAHGKYLQRFVVRAGRICKVIEAADILYFTSADRTTELHIEGISYAYDNSLSFLETRLSPELFLRVHRNAIVNLTAVLSYKTAEPGLVTMKDQKALKVSRHRLLPLRQALGEKD